MQSTFDIKLSNVRSRNQAIKQTRTRKNLNKKHQIVQLKTQNQLNSKHNRIRFKSALFQNRSFSMQKIEIFIQKQFVERHHLFQYIVHEKYVKFSRCIFEKYEKLSDSALRFIYDVSKINNIFVSERHRIMTYKKQIDQ